MAAEAPKQTEESVPMEQEETPAPASRVEESMPVDQGVSVEAAHAVEAAPDLSMAPADAQQDVAQAEAAEAATPELSTGTADSREVVMQAEDATPDLAAAVTDSREEAAPSATEPALVEGAETDAGSKCMTLPVSAFIEPQKPKRPVNAFFLFSCVARHVVSRELKKDGQPSQADITAAVKQRWADLPEAERLMYEDKENADKQRYEAEMQAYILSRDPAAPLRNKYMHLIPKKPSNPQGLFSQDAKQREKASAALVAEGTETGEKQITSKLNDMWKVLSTEDKIAYQAEHAKLHLEFLEKEKVWVASAEYKEIEQIEKQHREQQKVVEQAKKLAEQMRAQQELEEKKREQKESRTAKKRALTVGAVTTPPKRGRVSEQSTPPSTGTKSSKDKQVAMMQIDAKILKEASTLGYAAALENLASRPEVVSSKKTARAVLDALKKSGGLVNPAKRALLGL